MNEPHTPNPAWDALPVLTEVVETPVDEPTAELPVQADVPVLVDFDIPDFDFSAEMAKLSEALPDTALDFPVELTLDEVLSASDREGEPGLDAEAMIGRLPSLDLNVPLPDDMDLSEVLPGFAMPVEDAQSGSVPQLGTIDDEVVSESRPFVSVLPDAVGASAVAEGTMDVLGQDDLAASVADNIAPGELLEHEAVVASEAVLQTDYFAEPAAGLPATLESAPLPDDMQAAVLSESSGYGSAMGVADNVESLPSPAAVLGVLPDSVEILGDGVAELPADGLAASSVTDDGPVAVDDFAFDLGAPPGGVFVGVAAAYAESLGKQLAEDAPSAPSAYAIGQSISLDSLPTGVLGGGLGPAAMAATHDEPPSDPESDREVELGWARDLGVELPAELKRHFSRPLLDVATQDQPAVVPAVMPESAPDHFSEEPLPPVDAVIRPPAAEAIAEVALPVADAVMQLSAVRAVSPPLAVVSGAEGAVPSVSPDLLVEALYARVLPRMKVELALWMQDALEVQAKQLMSGVMQHLKEDFDMMLAEALRESLREAIDEAQGVSGGH